MQVTLSYGVFAARALSARCVSFVDGIPIFTLSIGETFRLLRGTLTVSTGVADESIFIPDMLDESVVIVDALSVCWLCVGVGATAPVPYCEESVVGAVLAAGAGVGSAQAQAPARRQAQVPARRRAPVRACW